MLFINRKLQFLSYLSTFMTCQLVSSRKSDPIQQGGSSSVLSGLTSKVTHQGFSHSLLVTESNPDVMWKRTTQACEYQEVRILGGHLEGWQPQWWVYFWVDYIITRKVIDLTKRDWEVSGWVWSSYKETITSLTRKLSIFPGLSVIMRLEKPSRYQLFGKSNKFFWGGCLVLSFDYLSEPIAGVYLS